MNETTRSENLVFARRGLLETADGRVAGLWVRTRRGRRVHLFTHPIRRARAESRVERKTIYVDGKPVHDVPVTLCPPGTSLIHWGK